MRPLLLCIGMTPERLMRLSFLAMQLGVELRTAGEDQWGQTLAALCGLEPPRDRAPKVRVGEEMLVMAFFEDALINRLLAALRQSGMAPIRLKAVLTAHNRAWNCGRLYTELSQEARPLDERRKEK